MTTHRVAMCAALVAAVLVGLPLTGCSTTPGPAGAAARADSLSDLEALFRQRLEESRSRYTEADVRFMTDMIHHHAQAVLMANLAVTRGASPAVQTLAARIRSGQVDEIAIMQQWLRERDRPVPEVDLDAGAGIADAHAAHDAHAGHGAHVAMPGMLTAAQLAALDRARGADFDRLFLSNMIEHHRGAVVMVDALLAADGAAQDAVVFRLASDIHVDQTAEIARMQRLLATLLGGRGDESRPQLQHSPRTRNP